MTVIVFESVLDRKTHLYIPCLFNEKENKFYIIHTDKILWCKGIIPKNKTITSFIHNNYKLHKEILLKKIEELKEENVNNIDIYKIHKSIIGFLIDE